MYKEEEDSEDISENVFKEEEIAEIHYLLNEFDYKKDGKLEIGNLGTIIRLLGNNPTEKQITEIALKLDHTKTGVFTEKALLHILSYYDFQEPTPQQVFSALNLFDYDNDDIIQSTDFEKAMEEFGEKMPESQIKKILQDLDPNYTGKFTLQKFMDLVK